MSSRSRFRSSAARGTARASRFTMRTQHNLKNLNRADSARDACLHHRRQRQRKIDARARCSLRPPSRRPKESIKESPGGISRRFAAPSVFPMWSLSINRRSAERPDPIRLPIQRRSTISARFSPKHAMPTAAVSVPGHFSFNLEAGRCETCQGNGTVTVEMQFLADVELTCEDCKGRRFKSSVLEVQYKAKEHCRGAGSDRP